MSKNTLLDLNLLQDYKENLGIELLNEMLALYEEKVVTYLDDIKDALSDKDNEKWYERCHKMKGAAGSMGFLQLTSHLKAIEHDASNEDIRAEYYKTTILLNESVVVAFKNWLLKN